MSKSLGGVQSSACCPALMSHKSLSKSQREKLNLKENLIRLSIGVENCNDLIEDLQQGFEYI